MYLIHFCLGNKIYSDNSHLRRINFGIYVYLTKLTRPNYSTTINGKVRIKCLSDGFLSCRCSDQESVAKVAEVDMIIADLDRANSRIVTLEHRNVSIPSPEIHFLFPQASFRPFRRFSVQILKRCVVVLKALNGRSPLHTSTHHLNYFFTQSQSTGNANCRSRS